MAEETDFENGRISKLTLKVSIGSGHTAFCYVAFITYIPNFTRIRHFVDGSKAGRPAL